MSDKYKGNPFIELENLHFWFAPTCGDFAYEKPSFGNVLNQEEALQLAGFILDNSSHDSVCKWLQRLPNNDGSNHEAIS